MEQLLNKDDGKTWDDYCKMLAATQLECKGKADNQTKAMLILMNSKNEPAKKDLFLAYAQGIHLSYPDKIEKITKTPIVTI